MNRLCQRCSTERARWLDYRLPAPLGIAHGSGAAYDVSAAGVRDRGRVRFEEWRATVRRNRDLIARACRAQGHIDTPGETVAAVVQLPLFDLLEQWEAA